MQLLRPDLKDSRPWYVKGYPFFNRGELRKRLKIITPFDGYLKSHRKTLERITLFWRKELAKYCNYDWKEKVLVFEEDSTELTSGETIQTLAKIVGVKDSKGKWIESFEQCGRLKKGTWFMAFIDLYPRNWPKVDVRLIEENVLHEICHLAFPDKGVHGDYEDEKEMAALVSDLIRKHGSATR